MKRYIRPLEVFIFLSVLISCTSASTPENLAKKSCSQTQAEWLQSPADSAFSEGPAYFFANEDQSILASAWWTGDSEYSLHAGKEGNKVGWFRPAGAVLTITGQRLDADAPPMKADVPAGYPTRFQASGLYFPTEGCWQVNATAEDKELSFVVWVEPQ